MDAYLDSRCIGRSFDRLRDLLLADKKRETLSYGEQRFITEKEVETWLKIEDIAKYADSYQAFLSENQVSRPTLTEKSKAGDSPNYSAPVNKPFVGNYHNKDNSFPPNKTYCTWCKSNGHNFSKCFKRLSTNTNTTASSKPNFPSISKMGVNKTGTRPSEGKSFCTHAVTVTDSLVTADDSSNELDDTDFTECYDDVDQPPKCAEINNISIRLID